MVKFNFKINENGVLDFDISGDGAEEDVRRKIIENKDEILAFIIGITAEADNWLNKSELYRGNKGKVGDEGSIESVIEVISSYKSGMDLDLEGDEVKRVKCLDH